MAKNSKDTIKDPIKDLLVGDDKSERKIAKLEHRAVGAVRKLAQQARDEGDYGARQWLKTIASLAS